MTDSLNSALSEVMDKLATAHRFGFPVPKDVAVKLGEALRMTVEERNRLFMLIYGCDCEDTGKKCTHDAEPYEVALERMSAKLEESEMHNAELAEQIKKYDALNSWYRQALYDVFMEDLGLDEVQMSRFADRWLHRMGQYERQYDEGKLHRRGSGPT